jgi:hypothetical protein
MKHVILSFIISFELRLKECHGANYSSNFGVRIISSFLDAEDFLLEM